MTLSGPKVLVIGGNRFFGKRLVARLIDEGSQVTVLNRGKLADTFGDRVQRIRLDRRELREGHPALGAGHWDVIYDQVCYDAIEAAGAVAAFNQRAGRYVFISSQSVYGLGKSIAESAFDPRTYAFDQVIPSLQDYSEAKRQAEAVFFKSDLPVTAVRFPIVLGPDDYTERLKFHVKNILAGTPIYFPNISADISLVQSGDAANFLYGLRNATPLGPVNVCSEEPISLTEIIKIIEAKTERAAKIVADSTAGEASPFGVSGDWYMDSKKMQQSGFAAAPILQWLPELVSHLKAECE